MGRGYQTGLLDRHQRLRDPLSRARKAAKIARALRSTGLPLGKATCLDVGCSSGTITAALSPLFGRTIGLEYDGAALAAADPVTRASVLLLRGDGMCLPLADGSVDVVLCAQVYEHVPDATRLAAEVKRVLAPGGIVFFSGPNWLYPIEPHYRLPFLHWLPAPLAARYLKLTGKGEHYYEQPRTLWGLRRLLCGLAVTDVNPGWVEDSCPRRLRRIVSAMPRWLWRLVQPIAPNFNWILRKSPTDAFSPEAGEAK